MEGELQVVRVRGVQEGDGGHGREPRREFSEESMGVVGVLDDGVRPFHVVAHAPPQKVLETGRTQHRGRGVRTAPLHYVVLPVGLAVADRFRSLRGASRTWTDSPRN